MKAKFTQKAFRTWAERIVKQRHAKRVKQANTSGGGTFTSDDDVDVAAAEWHEQKLAALEGTKKTRFG